MLSVCCVATQVVMKLQYLWWCKLSRQVAVLLFGWAGNRTKHVYLVLQGNFASPEGERVRSLGEQKTGRSISIRCRKCARQLRVARPALECATHGVEWQTGRKVAGLSTWNVRLFVSPQLYCSHLRLSDTKIEAGRSGEYDVCRWNSNSENQH